MCGVKRRRILLLACTLFHTTISINESTLASTYSKLYFWPVQKQLLSFSAGASLTFVLPVSQLALNNHPSGSVLSFQWVHWVSITMMRGCASISVSFVTPYHVSHSTVPQSREPSSTCLSLSGVRLLFNCNVGQLMFSTEDLRGGSGAHTQCSLSFLCLSRCGLSHIPAAETGPVSVCLETLYKEAQYSAPSY